MNLLRDLLFSLGVFATGLSADYLLNGAGRDAAYYVGMTLRFGGLVLGIVLLVAIFVRLLLFGLDRGLLRLLRDDVRLLVGWNFIKTSRFKFPLRVRARGLLLLWFGGDNARPRQGITLVGVALSVAALSLLLGRGGDIFGGKGMFGGNGVAWIPVYHPVLTRWLAWLPLFLAAPVLLRGAAHLALHPRSAAQRQERLMAARGLSGGRATKSVPLSIFVSVVGISVGVWALVVVLAVLSGFQNDLKSKLVEYNPNLEVAARRAGDPLPNWPALTKRLAALPGVTRATPMLSAEAMVASPSNINVNTTVHGIDALGWAATGPFKGSLRQGDFRHLAEPERRLSDTLLPRLLSPATKVDTGPSAEPSEALRPMGSIFAKPEGAAALVRPRPGIVIGRELARSLHVEPGSLIDLISPEGELSPAGLIPRSRSFEVVGVFETGLYEFDLKTVFVDRDQAQRFFGGDVNRIDVRLATLSDSDDLGREIASWGLDPDRVVVRDWKQFNRNLFSALALEKLVMFVVLGFIILVATFNIMSSLATVIIAKTRDIAILRSMGMSRADVFGTFRLIGLLVGGFGALCGATLGWASCLFIDWWGIKPPVQLYLQKLPVDLEPLSLLLIVLATVALSYLATIIPARRAAAVTPTEGLRYE